MASLKRFNIIFFNTLYIFFSFNINATSLEQLNSLKETAEQFVKSQIAVPKNGKISTHVAGLDSRLRISNCEAGLEPSIPSKQNYQHRLVVLIRCPSKDWQVYIPVDIRLLTPTLVAKQPLARGAMLNKEDLIVKLIDTRLHRGQIYSQISQLVGSKVKRRINIHNPITSNDVCMVCKNDNVLILSQNKHIRIETKGAALSDGILGEQIKVRNTRSNKIITAKISAVGEVIVNF